MPFFSDPFVDDMPTLNFLQPNLWEAPGTNGNSGYWTMFAGAGGGDGTSSNAGIGGTSVYAGDGGDGRKSGQGSGENGSVPGGGGGSVYRYTSSGGAIGGQGAAGSVRIYYIT